MKWYDESGKSSAIVVASRIRLVRNLRDYCFPCRLSETELEQLSSQIVQKLEGLVTENGVLKDAMVLEKLEPLKRNAFRERQIINQTAASQPGKSRLMLTEDESISITVNSENHLRIQISQSGLELEEIWNRLDRLDDSINELFPYAFDEKYGYLTAYPTSVGTGMRAYLILHLPLLDSLKRFSEITHEIGRYGVTVKPAFGKESDENGDLYVLYNQKTLGVTEKEIIQIINKVAGQLVSQERALRENAMENQNERIRDICYKAYGSLRYARMMTLSGAMHLLSQLRWGQEEGVIAFGRDCNFYEMMMNIQPCSLTRNYKPLSEEAQDQLRASYIRRQLPELAEGYLPQDWQEESSVKKGNEDNS